MAITTLPGATATDLTTLMGTDGADVFAPSVSESDSVVISALKGNDSITFANSLSASNIRAGRDSDTVTFQKALESSYVSGDKGTDTITVVEETFTSTIDGGESVDTLTFTGEVSNSFIYGGTSNDTITLSSLTTGTLVNGNADEDTFSITGALKTSTIYGGKGNDVYTAATLTESTLSGDKGNDDYTITGAVTQALITGGTGKDTVELTAASTTQGGSVLGGDGDDSVDWKGTTGEGFFIDGGAGDDDLEATGSLKDTFVGGLGDDAITVVNGDALIWGGSSEYDAEDGKDTIVAGNGDVTIFAAAGKDVITVGTGEAVVNAGLGDDKVTVGAGDASVNGGAGSDTVVMDDAALSKKDTLSGDDGEDILEITTLGADISDSDFSKVSTFETLEITGASTGAATLTLDSKFVASGISTITGEQTGNTVVIDASAVTTALNITATDTDLDDTIKGGTGNDTINTGADGEVDIEGGKGIDQFVAESAKTVDIKDFGTSSQTDTFNLTSSQTGAVNITVKSDFTATSSHVNNAGNTVTLTPDGAGTDINLTNAAGDTGFTIATATNSASTKNTLVGSSNADSITAAVGGSTITGGKDADALIGAAGTDVFKQSVGDSPAATATNLAANTLTASFTLTFGNGIDTLTTFATGTDTIDLAAAGATALNATDAINALTIGTNYLIRGAIAGGVFTQANAGADYLVFTAAATSLNGNAGAFGTNAIIGDGFAIATTDIV